MLTHAAQLVSQLSYEERAHLLADHLQDPTACMLLSQLDQDVAAGLLQLLGDNHPATRALVSEAARRLGEETLTKQPVFVCVGVQQQWRRRRLSIISVSKALNRPLPVSNCRCRLGNYSCCCAVGSPLKSTTSMVCF